VFSTVKLCSFIMDQIEENFMDGLPDVGSDNGSVSIISRGFGSNNAVAEAETLTKAEGKFKVL